MKKKLYCGLAAFTAFAFTACSDDSSVSAVTEPTAANSSSSLIEESSSSAIVESSSSAFAESSSSSFGLSSSDAVSSSSFVNSSSSLLASSSSSSFAMSSANECRTLMWLGGTDAGARVPVEECADSLWPENVIADGHWRIMETDSADGGKSSIVWPEVFQDGVDSMTSINEAYYGICGTAILDKGSLTYQPFVSVGFSLARDSSGNPVPVDVSNWGGICISYTSEYAPSIELDLGDSVNTDVLRYAVPTVGLTKSAVVTNVKCLPWSSFKIPSWFRGDDQGWKEDTGAKAAKQLVGVRFRLQAHPPREGGYMFNIRSISAYNSGSGYYAAKPLEQ